MAKHPSHALLDRLPEVQRCLRANRVLPSWARDGLLAWLDAAAATRERRRRGAEVARGRNWRNATRGGHEQ